MSIVAQQCAACLFDADPPHEFGGRVYCPDCFAAVAERHPEALRQPTGCGTRLRPYQDDAVNAVLDCLRQHRSTLAVMPTGCGKTIVFAEVIRRWPEGRILVVAHRDELIWQAVRKIEAVAGCECDVEMGDYYADQRSLHGRARVVVTSVQTMSRARRHERFHADEFSLVIKDEAHHAVAKTYKSIADYFAAAKILGVTATPDRADERALGQVFASVAYEYQLPAAIRDGWLVPIQQQFVFLESIDLSVVEGTGKKDLSDQQSAKALDKSVLAIAKETMERAGGEQTIVFASSVDHAEMMAEFCNSRRGGSAGWVCGDEQRTPKDVRRDTLKRFSDRQFQYLFNCGVLLEGYDEPGIGVVAIARLTKSRSLYAQMIGRGTRSLPGVIDGLETAELRRQAIAASAKPSVTVLDFVGNSAQHKLVYVADILGGEYEDEVIASATAAVKAASDRGERVDMLTALAQAEEAKRHAMRERLRRVDVAVKSSARIVDPFAVWDVLPKREPGWHVGRKPTEKQAAYLEKIGIPAKELEKLSFCKASQLIDESMKRRAAGKCTYKQAKLLTGYGLSTDVSFDQASEWIDRIAKNGWRLPADIHS